MSTVTSDVPLGLLPPPGPDPFRYGWRYVMERDKNGAEKSVQIPLTQEDVLHPQEGDCIVQTPLHDLVRGYLRDAGKGHFDGRADIIIISDNRVDWGSKQGWIHGPDWALFSGSKKPWGLLKATLKLKEFGAKTECLIEVTSKGARHNDYGPKMQEYFLVGVPQYVIVDIPDEGKEGAIRIFGFQAGKTQFEPMQADDKGRLPLGGSDLLIGVEGSNVYLEDAQGRRLPDFEAWKARAEQAEERIAAEQAARLEMESRLRALEAELAQLKQRD